MPALPLEVHIVIVDEVIFHLVIKRYSPTRLPRSLRLGIRVIVTPALALIATAAAPSPQRELTKETAATIYCLTAAGPPPNCQM